MTANFMEEAKKTKNGKRITKGMIKSIIEDVNTKRKLLSDFSVSPATIQQRVSRKSYYLIHRGHPSPLHNIEATVVATMKQTCCIRQNLTPTQGLVLVSIIIEETDAQRDLVEFQKKLLYFRKTER